MKLDNLNNLTDSVKNHGLEHKPKKLIINNAAPQPYDGVLYLSSLVGPNSRQLVSTTTDALYELTEEQETLRLGAKIDSLKTAGLDVDPEDTDLSGVSKRAINGFGQILTTSTGESAAHLARSAPLFTGKGSNPDFAVHSYSADNPDGVGKKYSEVNTPTAVSGDTAEARKASYSASINKVWAATRVIVSGAEQARWLAVHSTENKTTQPLLVYKDTWKGTDKLGGLSKEHALWTKTNQYLTKVVNEHSSLMTVWAPWAGYEGKDYMARRANTYAARVGSWIRSVSNGLEEGARSQYFQQVLVDYIKYTGHTADQEKKPKYKLFIKAIKSLNDKDTDNGEKKAVFTSYKNQLTIILPDKLKQKFADTVDKEGSSIEEKIANLETFLSEAIKVKSKD